MNASVLMLLKAVENEITADPKLGLNDCAKDGGQEFVSMVLCTPLNFD